MNVEELLNDRRISFTPKGQDYVVRCLNPEHEDNNPSMHIDKLTGSYQCFSCGFKGNVFKLYNVSRDWQNIKVKKLQDKISRIRQSSIGLSIPSNSVPFNKDYRNIKAETYISVGAFTHNDSEHVGRVVFPLKDITGRIKAFIGRYVNSNADPKYNISPANVELPLFPAKVKTVYGSIILVEGIFDALNLIDKGVPNAVAVLGVKNINVENMRALKLQGVSKIWVMFDGDGAGLAGAIEAKRLLEEDFIVDIESMSLQNEEGLDPGSLNQTQVNHIINMLKQD
jgi:DNA primase